MPIKGKTDQLSEKRGYPLLGRIHKGTKKRKITKNGKEIEIMGTDTDEFRMTLELEKIEKPNAEEQALIQFYRDQWVAVYGEHPRRFDDIKLYYPTPDRAMDSWYKEHDGKGVVCVCDGETRKFWWDKERRGYSRVPAPCIFAQGGECDCVMTAEIPMFFMKFSLLTGIYGYFLLSTHSSNDIDNLHAAMCEVYNVTNDLTQVVFTLSRVPTPKTFVDEKTHERMKTTKSLLSLSGGVQFTRKFIVPPAYRDQYAALIGDPEPEQLTGPNKPPPQQRFPLPGEDTRAIAAQSVTYIDTPPPDEQADETNDLSRPPVDVRLSLKVMKVRSAFIVLAKEQGFDADTILETCGVSDFNSLEWFETCERLEIDIEPPAELMKGK